MTVNRVEYDAAGYLDEIVTDGGAHFERLGGEKWGVRWFLECVRADGSSVAVYINGRVDLVEERPAPSTEGGE